MANMKDKWERRELSIWNNLKMATNDMKKSIIHPANDTRTIKPIAYDVDGKPLYAAPQGTHPESDEATSHTVDSSSYTQDKLHAQKIGRMNRPLEPAEVAISEETKRRHEQSMRDYPDLNLSEHEYVISDVPRHPIGMIGPLIATGLSVTLVFILLLNYPFFAEALNLPMTSYGLLLLMGILLILLFIIGGYLAIWVYLSNKFYLTNESVIQEIQMSIFSKREQTVSLMNIEDASYSQKGPIQTLFDFGSIRLSTEGEETTYRFNYVAGPRDQIAILNNAVEGFKNGRPVDPLSELPGSRIAED